MADNGAKAVEDSQGHDLHWDEVQEAVELLREDEVDRAVETLETILRDDSRNPYAAFFLGEAWFAKQVWDKALRGYVRALELRPDYLGAMLGAGHALRMMGRLDQAIRMARQILSRQKDNPDGLYLLGLAHYQRGDGADAERWLSRFLNTRPEIEVAMEVEGLLQILRGQAEGLNTKS